jgi:hypothetical protein
MSEFKVGDRVRVKMSSSDFKGSVGTVTVPNSMGTASVKLDGKAVSWHYCPHELELLHRPEESDGKTANKPARKHGHYFKDVSKINEIDVYRILDLYNVTDQAIGHALKKLLVAGGRGHKDVAKDIQEAIDTLVRWQAMRAEEAA